MRIATSKYSKPKFIRLRRVPTAPKAPEPKPQTRMQRFLATPTFDLKYVGDHLKNYFTVGGLCLLAVWLARKGGNYDRTAPFLGAAMAFLIAVAAFVFGALNVVQMMDALRQSGNKGWRWRLGYSASLVFLCFFLTAVFQHGMDTKAAIGPHAAEPNR